MGVMLGASTISASTICAYSRAVNVGRRGVVGVLADYEYELYILSGVTQIDRLGLYFRGGIRSRSHNEVTRWRIMASVRQIMAKSWHILTVPLEISVRKLNTSPGRCTFTCVP
jgi:hypothetical protein